MDDLALFHPLLRLQQTIGNGAVPRLLAHRGKTLQAKLTVGAADDLYEQEADRVAQEALSMPTPVSAVTSQASFQQQPPVGGEAPQTKPLTTAITPFVQRTLEQEDEIQTNATMQYADPLGSFEPGADFAERLNTSSDGRPLPPSSRAFMESRFGADFSGVQTHTGSEVTRVNRAIGAQAFTHGQHIYLGEGRNDVESSAGKQLLAHELTHTIQQAKGASRIQRALRPDEMNTTGGDKFASQMFATTGDPITLVTPGTSCLATIMLSLRDKIHSTAEALLKFALMHPPQTHQ